MKVSGFVLTEEKVVELRDINTESSPVYLRLKIEIFFVVISIQLSVL